MRKDLTSLLLLLFLPLSYTQPALFPSPPPSHYICIILTHYPIIHLATLLCISLQEIEEECSLLFHSIILHCTLLFQYSSKVKDAKDSKAAI